MKKAISVLFLTALFAANLRPAVAQERGSLAEVVQNQQRILQALEEIKQELAIIKVRATNR